MCAVISLWSCLISYVFFFFKQKTAYEMRISDWSSDVCSSDLEDEDQRGEHHHRAAADRIGKPPGGERADRAARQQRRDRYPQPDIVEREGLAQSVLRAVDHARIVSEHEATDRRDRHDQRDQALVDPLVGPLSHPRLSLPPDSRRSDETP